MKKRTWYFLIVVILSAGIFVTTLFISKENINKGQTTDLQNLNLLSIVFEPNIGQADKDVNFVHFGKNYSLSLKNTESVFSFDVPLKKNNQDIIEHSKSSKYHKTEIVQSTKVDLCLKFLNANPNAKGIAKNPLKGQSNYLLGNNPDKWLKDIPHFGKIRYNEVYSGIDLEYYGNDTQLEYDFIVSPGADPNQIKFKLEGAKNIYLNKQGDLIVAMNQGSLIMQSPNIYQNIDGKREKVSGRYKINREKEVYFTIDDYLSDKTLVIDPVLIYSTFLGGNTYETSRGIKLDNEGNIYIAGHSASDLFAGTPNPLGSGVRNAFVLKLDPTATSIIYVSFFGGTNAEYANCLDVDDAGHVYVAGYTKSNDFPIANAWQDHNKGGWIGDGEDHYEDAFVTKLNPEGNGFIYSTYLGSELQDEYGVGNPTYGCDEATGIAADASGNAYVVGWTNSVHFYTSANAYQKESGAWAHDHENDAFLTKFDPSGSVVYSTYFGGVNTYETNGVYEKDIWANDEATGIAVDDLGNMYVTGFTEADSFPTTPGAYQTDGGVSWMHCFVTKFNPSGTDLVFSTILAGNYEDISESICIDKDKNVYITGLTGSDDFPTVNSYQPPLVGATEWDSFMAKISADGSNLLYSTYWGADGTNDISRAIAVDDLGHVYITGYTNSPNLVVKDGNPYGGEDDVFIVKFDPNKAGDESLIYSTYLGGSSSEYSNAIAVDHNHNVLVTGLTKSQNFPISDDAIQPTIDGTEFSPGLLLGDAFISKIGKKLKFDIFPDGIAYDVLHWDSEVGPLQSSFPTIEITGSGLSEVYAVVFKLPNGSDDPYMIVSNIQASENKVAFDLAVAHSAYLGEREIILKVKNKPDINATNHIGRKFIVTRMKVFFNQAVNTSELQTHAHREILIANKKGTMRIQMDDESQLGTQLELERQFLGKLRVADMTADSTSRQLYSYKAGYTEDEIIQGLDYLSIPFPENLSSGEHTFRFLMARDDGLSFGGPLIKQRFLQSRGLNILVRRYQAKKTDGTKLEPPTEAALNAVDKFTKLVYPISDNQLTCTIEDQVLDLPEKIKLEEGMYKSNKVTYIPRAARRKLVNSLGELLDTQKEFLSYNVIAVFLPDNLLYMDRDRDGKLDFAAAGLAYSEYRVILCSASSQFGILLAHELGHVIDEAIFFDQELEDIINRDHFYNLGDEYTEGVFYCGVNSPVIENKGWINNKKDQSCDNSPYSSGINGDLNGIWTSLSAFNPVKMNPKFYWNGINKRIRYYNFMAGNTPVDSTWVSVKTYDVLMKVFIPEATTQSASFTSNISIASEKIDISGSIYDDDRAFFDNLDIVNSVGISPPLTGPYSIELQNVAGSVLSSHQFDVSFVKISEPPILTDHAFFHVRLERPVGTKYVVLKKDNIKLASRTLSDNPPVVQITNPQEGGTISGNVEIRWSGSDLDNDSLNYSLLFSPEPGIILPIDALLTDTKYNFDFSEYPASPTASITIIACDGLNRSEATVNVKIEKPVSVDKESRIKPKGFHLFQNYPNPVNPTTEIKYSIPKADVTVSLIIYDISGNEIKTLVNERKSAGIHSIKWNGRNNDGLKVASGLYFYRLEAGSFVEVKKMMLMK